MALSNWDTFAVTHEGKPSSGSLVTPCGVQVEIYKNWIYVRDKKGWQKDSGWSEPTVMQVDSGQIHYKDLHIFAVRGPSEGVYCAVWYDDYKTGKFEGFVGIGSSGYRYPDPNGPCEPEWVGIGEEEIAFLKKEVIGHEEKVKFPIRGSSWDGKKSTPIFEEMEIEEWTTPIPEELQNVSLDDGLRFNQGDAYFAAAVAEDCIPGTKPGEAEAPVLMQMLKEG